MYQLMHLFATLCIYFFSPQTKSFSETDKDYAKDLLKRCTIHLEPLALNRSPWKVTFARMTKQIHYTNQQRRTEKCAQHQRCAGIYPNIWAPLPHLWMNVWLMHWPPQPHEMAAA